MSKLAAQSVMTKKVKGKEEAIQKQLAKTFSGWMNHRLSLKNRDQDRADDPMEAIPDGIYLIHVLESVFDKDCEQTVGKKYNRKPTMVSHRIDNMSVAVEFLQSCVPYKLNVEPKDVVDKNMKVTLGMLWRLVSAHMLADAQNADGTQATANQRNRLIAQNLLNWSKKMTEGYNGVNIESLDQSFNDGLAFAAIVHKLDPSAIDFDSLTAENAKENLAKAFAAAEERFKIPQLLDPEDFNNPDAPIDEKAIMTYLTEFVVYAADKHIEASRGPTPEEIQKQKEEAERIARIRAEREAADEAAKKQAQEMAQFYERQAQMRAEEQAKLLAEKEELEANLASISIDEDPDLIREHQRLLEAQIRLKDEIAKYQAENEDLHLQILSLKKKLIGTLKVTIHQAKDLKRSLKYANMIDPFATAAVETQQYRTKTHMGKTAPVFDQSFLFFISDPAAKIELKMMDWHFLIKPSFKGEIVVPLSDLTPDKEVKQWYKLTKQKKDNKPGNYGEVELTLLYSKGGPVKA